MNIIRRNETKELTVSKHKAMKQYKGHPGSYVVFIAFPGVMKKRKFANVPPKPVSSQRLQVSNSCYLFEELEPRRLSLHSYRCESLESNFTISSVCAGDSSVKHMTAPGKTTGFHSRQK
jgi:hypothetical protein